MKIGFIGLGALGSAMTRRLLAAGHEVTVASRSRPPIDAAIAAGALDGKDPAGVARASEVIFICVPLAPDVSAVIDAMLPALDAGKIVVDCSTIGPDAELEFHRRVGATGASYLEAPVSGVPRVADEGRMTVYAAGAPEVLERVRPALEAFAKTIELLGGPGAGQSAKLCNNILSSAQILAVAEATALAMRAGLDIAAFRRVVMQSTGDCNAIRNRIPVEGIVPQSPASNGWKGFPTHFEIEELDMILAFAAKRGVHLLTTSLVRKVLALSSEAGYANEDYSAMAKMFQDPAKHPEAREWIAETSQRLFSAADAGKPW